MNFTAILNTVYSLPFFLGATAGWGLWTIYCRQKARYMDAHRPLADGRHHEVARLSRIWIAGLVMVFSVGYVLLSANKAHDDTVALAKRVTSCWRESYRQTKVQIDINSQNDFVSRQQQQLQRDYDRATSDWLKALINPPGALANQPSDSPDRRAWALQVSAMYQQKLDDLGDKFDELVAQRAKLDDERAQHPLPEPTCGK